MHLDIKPTNVRVDSHGEPIVMDFGLARLSETDFPDPLGGPLGVAGTPLYMAPEQIENRDDLDVRADIFALGLLLYEVFVGKRARGESWGRFAVPTRDMAGERPPPPRQIDPSIPREVEAMILRAIEIDRGRRYQSARALAEDLAAFREGRVVGAMSDDTWYRFRKWLHANKLAVATLGFIILVMGGSVAFKLQMDRVTEDKLEFIKRGVQEASVVAAQSELIRAYEQIGELADRLGDHELADRSYERAAAIRSRVRN
jgi:serine/threonine protein kinase